MARALRLLRNVLCAVACLVGMGGCVGPRSARPEEPHGRALVIVVPADPAGPRDDAGAPSPPSTNDDDASGAGPAEQPGLVTTSLTRFASLTKACAGLVSSSTSEVLRHQPGSTFTSVRTVCRARTVIITEPPLPGRGSGRAASLVELRRTTSFPRHADVDSVVVAPAFPVGATEWAVALEGREESDAMVSMPRGDQSGRVDLTLATRVDLVGTDEPEVVLVLTAYESAVESERVDFLVCDSGGAWCTRPANLDEAGRGGEENDPWANAPRARATTPRTYSFRRHPRGVEVTTSGDPPVPARVFPLR